MANAEDGFEYFDSKEAAAGLYAQIGIGHALVRLGDILEEAQHDLNAIELRLREVVERLESRG